jgi:glutaredoxin
MSKLSIKSKVVRVAWNKKDNITYKSELPKDIEALEPYINDNTSILHQHTCGYKWAVKPTNILQGKGCPKCSKVQRTDIEYQALVPEDIEVLEKYTRVDVKLLHRHTICGHEWYVIPHSILRGSSCPNCSKTGFNTGKLAITYLVYFHALGIYKVGITNRTVKERFQSEPQPYKVILERHFEKGVDARDLETKWLKNLKPLLYNTTELKDGNTETFIYD